VDWTQLRVDVITVEYRVMVGKRLSIDRPATLKKLTDLRQFFSDTGLYRERALLPSGAEAEGLDVVFSHI